MGKRYAAWELTMAGCGGLFVGLSAVMSWGAGWFLLLVGAALFGLSFIPTEDRT
jgi:hypothetical protein